MNFVTITALLFLSMLDKQIPPDAKPTKVEQSFIMSLGGEAKRADEVSTATAPFTMQVELEPVER
ncbi:MAG: hypothetical protein QM817_36035 [Archangium sp.]